MVSVIVGVGRWVAQWVWVGGLPICSLGCFSGFFTGFFFLLDAGVDLVAQWQAGGWVDDGGCLMMVAVGVVLRDDSVKRNDYFIE